ncbi:MAG: translation elongation factor-like protein [Deltaproteobacteria bacterium]|nr:translation elongation factor-like protein [Deltaproteobacteria bacterium]MBI2342528.1 translation elongation factor-like protein [Deltaproteobacteria bacterium]
MPEKEIGFVEHWFGHIMVAGIKITNGPLKVGDTIHVKGHTTDITTTIKSMQINNKDITEAKTGDDIGMKMPDHARQHDKVYLVTP